MRLSYSLQRQEFLAALEAVVGSISETEMHRSSSRRLRLVPYLYYPALGVAGLVALAIEPHSWRGLMIMVIGFCLATAALNWFVMSTQTAQLGATFEPRRHNDVTAIFDAETAEYVGREHRQVWKLTLLRRFHELPTVLVLEFAGFDMLVVPRRAFTSPGEVENWAKDIRACVAPSG